MYDLEAHPKSLLTVDANPKLAKDSELWLTAGLHLTPASFAGVGDMCPYSSAGCRAACLNYSGHGQIGLDADGLNTVQVARIRRTRYFKRDRDQFMLDLVFEIERLERRAIRQHKRLAVRLNVLSDQLWERIPVGAHPNIMSMFPGVTFYDYTKIPMRYRADRVAAIPNYMLTFSLSESNDRHAADALLSGVNVAVAFHVRKGAPLPKEYTINGVTAPVIDGDLSDHRFLDTRVSIVGLRAKGTNGKADTSGFIRNV